MTQRSFERNEFYPHGATRKDTARFMLATGGTYLIEDVHSNGSAGKLDFMVVIWGDKDARTDKFLTCGNGGSNPWRVPGTAHWEGNSFINEYELTLRGAKRKWQDIFSEKTPRSFTLVASMESPDGAMQPMIRRIREATAVTGNGQ